MNAASNSASAQTRVNAPEAARNERTGSANAGPSRAHDASMEEILASIRKIIADEQAIPAAEREPSEVVFARARGPGADGADPAARGPAVPAAAGDDSDFEGWLAATVSGAAIRPDPNDREPGAVAPGDAAPADVEDTVAADSADLPVEGAAPETDFAAIADTPATPVGWDATERDGGNITGSEAVPAAGPVPDVDAQALGAERAAPRLSVVDAAQEAHAPAPAPEPASQAGHAPLDGERPLLSADASSSINSSFQALAHSAMLRNSAVMEQAVREMLRPMLKQWLDDNLPPIVERLVRAEIERAARGGP